MLYDLESSGRNLNTRVDFPLQPFSFLLYLGISHFIVAVSQT